MTTTAPSRPPSLEGPDTFAVRNRIGRATGTVGRYACDAVRVLPTPKRNQVVLQATDGHQATCVLAPGTMTAPRLVPTSVLPTRRAAQPTHVRLVNGQWQSSEGKLAGDEHAPDTKFPPVGDVLPVVGGRPFYETARHAEQRRAAAASASRGKGGEPPESMHVVLGIDVAKLGKVAEGLGTPKLTLFVPVPIRRRSDRRSAANVCVNKAIAVCPAERDDGAGGIGVIMPFQPDQTAADYAQLRQLVVDAEKRLEKKPRSRTTG